MKGRPLPLPVMGVACLAAGLAVSRGSDTVSIRGYLKTFGSCTVVDGAALPVGSRQDETLFDNATRLRAELRWHPFRNSEGTAAYEANLAMGDSLDTALLPVVPGLRERPRFLDMQSTVTERGDVWVRHAIDRLAWRQAWGAATVTLGRQSVSWGTGYTWSPLDLFTAFPPTEIDRDEKIGVDVFRLEYAFGLHTLLDVVFEPLNMDRPYDVASDDSTLAARLQGHAGEFDVSVAGGSVAGDAVAGLDFSGYLGNAGVRGDARYTWVDAGEGGNYVQALLGADYGFRTRWQPTLSVEVFHNGYGGDDTADYLQLLQQARVQRLLRRGTGYSLGRDYAALILGLVPSALTSVQSQTVVNVSDGSAREYVSFAWSVRSNLELLLGVNLGIGGDQTEFGRGDLYFTYLKAYF